MAPHPFFGVLLHAIGGLAAGSFYIPFKRVKAWHWESYWLVGGVFSWIIAPLIFAHLTVHQLHAVLHSSHISSLLWSYLFGVLWGIGGLTFGLSVRYLGFSLGYAMSLGFCAVFGTLIPPLFRGEFHDLLTTGSGHTLLTGILVCLAGIATCGRAGIRKEKEMSGEMKRQSVEEFQFLQGVWVAIFAGVMSSCMAFGFAAGAPIAEKAAQLGTPEVFKNNAVLVVVLAGGFTTNAIWCVILLFSHHSWKDYVTAPPGSLLLNYLFSALAGSTWYFQFFFYGMGTTQMGKYDFSSWTLHMAFIIIFSNAWGIFFHEWRGTARLTVRIIYIGLMILLISTIIVGYANYLAAQTS